ncbi:hypothetical protein KTAU_00370 [Thermogemmatispora aurantia]|uniref:Uncharacterized protein n=1 Tax=Thermogemmatispora aurantia TaxID=2045279 RepID=A0A5J4JTR2_9CHLR|nr:hypothetical protein KTAU_00370 [Thermogemmatispora aurantia]
MLLPLLHKKSIITVYQLVEEKKGREENDSPGPDWLARDSQSGRDQGQEPDLRGRGNRYEVVALSLGVEP